MSKRFRKKASLVDQLRQWGRDPRFLGVLAGALVLIFAIALIGGGDKSAVPKPRIAYLSSLSLAYGEGDVGDVLSGQSNADPFFVRLSEQYRMEPIDSLEKLPDVAPDALLLIQPRAFSPAENVALDRWLRSGGEMVFLVDPALTRESEHPLGDARRPLFTSMASPILKHWGLELTLPMDDASPLVERSAMGEDFETRAPGAFRKIPQQMGNADCTLAEEGFLVRCEIGEGVVILLADADLIDPALWQKSTLWGEQDGAVRAVESLLEDLTSPAR